jgi:hypothetical protein
MGREFIADPAEARDFERRWHLPQGRIPAAQNRVARIHQALSAKRLPATALFWLGNAQYANRD